MLAFLFLTVATAYSRALLDKLSDQAPHLRPHFNAFDLAVRKLQATTTSATAPTFSFETLCGDKCWEQTTNMVAQTLKVMNDPRCKAFAFHYYYYSSESYFNEHSSAHGMAMEQEIHSECTLLLFDKSRVPEGRVRDVVKKFNPQQSHSENGGVAEREQDPVYDATIVYGKEWSHSIEKSAAVQAVSSSSASSSAFASSSASYSSEETPMYEDVYYPRTDYEDVYNEYKIEYVYDYRREESSEYYAFCVQGEGLEEVLSDEVLTGLGVTHVDRHASLIQSLCGEMAWGDQKPDDICWEYVSYNQPVLPVGVTAARPHCDEWNTPFAPCSDDMGMDPFMDIFCADTPAAQRERDMMIAMMVSAPGGFPGRPGVAPPTKEDVEFCMDGMMNMMCGMCTDDCDTKEKQTHVTDFFCAVDDHAFGMGGQDTSGGMMPSAGAFSPRRPPSADAFRAMLDFMCMKDPQKDKLCYDIQAEILQRPGVVGGEDAEDVDMCTIDCASPQAAAVLDLGCCLPSFIAANEVFNLDKGYLSTEDFHETMATIAACTDESHAVRHACAGTKDKVGSDILVFEEPLEDDCADCSCFDDYDEGSARLKEQVSRALAAVYVRENDVTFWGCKACAPERRLQEDGLGAPPEADDRGVVTFSIAISSETDLDARRQEILDAGSPLAMVEHRGSDAVEHWMAESGAALAAVGLAAALA